MSAFGGKADMIFCGAHVAFGHGTLGGANLNRNVAHPELGGGNETTRFHNTIGWFRGLMAAYVACPAGGDASDRISQQWIA
jgi:hypothetical protein